MKLSDILSGSKYSLSQFSEDKIAKLENAIVEKESKGKVFKLRSLRKLIKPTKIKTLK